MQLYRWWLDGCISPNQTCIVQPNMFGWLGRPHSQACGVQKGSPACIAGNEFRFRFRLVQAALAPRGQFCGPSLCTPQPVLCKEQNPPPRWGIARLPLHSTHLRRPASASLSARSRPRSSPSQTHAVAELGFHRRLFPASASSKGSPSATSSHPSVGLRGTVLPSSLFVLHLMLPPTPILCVLML